MTDTAANTHLHLLGLHSAVSSWMRDQHNQRQRRFEQQVTTHPNSHAAQYVGPRSMLSSELKKLVVPAVRGVVSHQNLRHDLARKAGPNTHR